MLVYILKSTAILAVLLVFYQLFLEKENIHVFKRHFLLVSILLAIGIPSITFTNYIEAQPLITPLATAEFEVVNEVAPTIDYTAVILWSLYGLGVLFFAIRFLVNLTKIGLRIKNNPKLKKNGFVNVLIQDLAIPHTFFSYIFFNKYAFEAKKIPNEVTIHEQTHAKQLHSLDIIIIELLQIVFWFNPLLYVLKNYIKLNHEFLADEAVLKSGTELKKYQKTLLAYANTHNHYPIANAINYSSIKKRFTIMKTKSSRKKAWLKSLLLLPLVSVLIYGFSTQETVISKQMIGQETQESETIKIPEINVIDEATLEQMKEYDKLVTFYSSKPWSETIVKLKDIKRMKMLRNLMSVEQKKSAKPFPNLPLPPKSPVIKIGVNDKDYNIPPPPISKKGDALKIYKAKNNYYEKLRSVKPHFIKRSKKEQNRMHELFSELGGLYFSLSKQNKRKVKRPVFPHFPYVRLNKNGKNYYKLKKELTEEDKNNLPKPPPPPRNQKTGYKTINNEKLYYVENGGKRQYYNKFGDNVYVKEILSGPQKGETLAITEINETPVDEIEIVEEIQETESISIEDEEVIHEQLVEEEVEEIQEQQKAKTGWEYINDKTYYYVEENGKKQYYNRWGNKVSFNNNKEEIVEEEDKETQQQQKAKTGWEYIKNKTYYYIEENGKKQYYNRFGKKVTFTDKELNKKQTTIDKLDNLTNDENRIKEYYNKWKNKEANYYINGRLAFYETVIALDKNSIDKINVIRKKNKKPAIYITTKKGL